MTAVCTLMFQSSPDPKAECNRVIPSARANPYVFQSSPDPKAECNALTPESTYQAFNVSILTRPEGRVQRGRAVEFLTGMLVSILTRPEGRVQLSSPRSSVTAILFQSSPDPKAECNTLWHCTVRSRAMCFNPHPTRRPSATWRPRILRRGHRGFNPHPTRRPSATPRNPSLDTGRSVSILTRPEGRVQPASRLSSC